MKLLLIDVNCKNSSTGNIVYNLYNYINSSGDEAAVCYGRGPKIEEKNIFKFGIDAETYLHALLTRITGFTGCFSFFSTRRLIRFIKEFNPDVVHIHELHAYFVNIKPLINYLKKNHIKTVMTLHCEFAYTGKCGHSVDCEQWKTECRKCPHLKDYVSTLWFDHTNYMFRQKRALFDGFKELYIITPSQWLTNRAKASMLKNHSISTINNGIDTEIFQPKNPNTLKTEFGIKNNEIVVLALAPHIMSENKGGKYVMDIAKHLKNIRFILVGVDGVENRSIENIIEVGPIFDKNRLADFYSLADAFLICSKRENFPTTCLEAQACGTPIYGFSTGGTTETSVDTIENHFVEYGDINALTKIISSLKKKNNDTVLYYSQMAKKRFGEEISLKNYYMLYKELL